MMNTTQIEQEIAVLEERLTQAIANKPAHDTTGEYEAVILEIDDELYEMRKVLDSEHYRLGPSQEEPSE